VQARSLQPRPDASPDSLCWAGSQEVLPDSLSRDREARRHPIPPTGHPPRQPRIEPHHPVLPNGEIRRMRFEKRKHPPVPPLAADAPTLSPMIRIAITAAYEAICPTLPLGTVAVEAAANERGERLIWLEAAMADRLGAMRGPGESLSDVIIRLAAAERCA
jgi:hypothetical protein